MTLIRTRATDGSSVEFIYDNPMSGSQKDVYWSPDKKYVVAFYKKTLSSNERERIKKIIGEYYVGIFGDDTSKPPVKSVGSEYWKKVFCWPKKGLIVEHDGRTGIVVPAYDSCYQKKTDNFLLPKSFNQLPPEEKGDLLRFLVVCLHLARGVRRLHAPGLSHSDLSHNNCRIDPKSANACIIDCDSLVVPNWFPPVVDGTPGFIAPEVLATSHLPVNDCNKKLPCKETDRHALAVLIYSCLFHRHPLEGDKIHDADTDKNDMLAMGERALWIENSKDKSNRRQSQNFDREDRKKLPWIDTTTLPYTILGPWLQILFERAFIEGLHHPGKRPSANDWEEALLATIDIVLPCQNDSCVKHWFVLSEISEKQKCPYCGTLFRGDVAVLDFYTADGRPVAVNNKRLVVRDQLKLHQWHSQNGLVSNEKLKDEQKKKIGRFYRNNGKWTLVNKGLPGMKNITTGKDIPIGHDVELTDGLQLLLSSGTNGRLAKVRIVNN
ncbi:MAG: hypothetical protein LBQ54_08295 [Planctomycetaceae bacterium]|jgi:serine/threonine protein kinase|nr:hypothetical protein [Planctomycetaceae bacterium]